MTVNINGGTYYRTAEVCRLVGISRNTLFRWLKEAVISVDHRDCRGWRIFTTDQVEELRKRTGTIVSVPIKTA